MKETKKKTKKDNKLTDIQPSKPLLTDVEYIEVQGARVHNLKNIDVNIPREQLVVLTGLSGVGSPLWHLIPSMQRGNVAISRHSRRMHGSSSAD